MRLNVLSLEKINHFPCDQGIKSRPVRSLVSSSKLKNWFSLIPSISTTTTTHKKRNCRQCETQVYFIHWDEVGSDGSKNEEGRVLHLWLLKKCCDWACSTFILLLAWWKLWLLEKHCNDKILLSRNLETTPNMGAAKKKRKVLKKLTKATKLKTKGITGIIGCCRSFLFEPFSLFHPKAIARDL